jgi:hypothetical protein
MADFKQISSFSSWRQEVKFLEGKENLHCSFNPEFVEYKKVPKNIWLADSRKDRPGPMAGHPPPPHYRKYLLYCPSNRTGFHLPYLYLFECRDSLFLKMFKMK